MNKGGQIKQNSLKQLKWTTLGMVLPKLISPILTLWMVKLLDPSDFGLVAISSAIIGFTPVFQGLGLIDIIIKDQDLSEQKVNTIFWISFFFSVLMTILILSFSTFFSNIYHNDRLNTIIPCLSITIILTSLQLVPNALLQKQLNFKKIFLIQVMPLLVMISITLPLALMGWGVWSLVIGQIVNSFLSLLMYSIYTGWVPKFVFSIVDFKSMFVFGRWVLLEKVIEYLYSNLDLLIIGIYFDLVVVGLYSTGKYLITMIFTIINGSVGAITLPMLGIIRIKTHELKDAFFGVIKRIIFFNLPIMAGIATLSRFIIPIIFPNKWESLYVIVSILVIGEGIMRNFWVQRDLFKLIDKPNIYPQSILINIIFAIIFFPIAFKYGVIGFCIIKVLNDLIYSIVQIIITSEHLNFSIYELFNNIKVTFFSTLLLAFSLLLSLYIIHFSGLPLDFITIFFVIIFSGVLYLISQYFLDKIWFLKFSHEIKSIL